MSVHSGKLWNQKRKVHLGQQSAPLQPLETNLSSSEKERVEAMVVSFEEQLSIARPDVPSFFQNAESVSNDSDERNEASELRDSMGIVIEELPYPGDFYAFKTAIIMVAEKWKSEKDKGLPSTKPSTKSFSLFDQLQGGFAMPVRKSQTHQQNRRLVQGKMTQVFARVSPFSNMQSFEDNRPMQGASDPHENTQYNGLHHQDYIT